jgi:ubiquinone/menaquinone biosynthesis C-methylase UbiE
MHPSAFPIEQIKESLRATWMAGDFGVVAKTISVGAEEFVSGLGNPAGTRVLDVACGTGNLAIPLARQGAQVTGVDIATNLLTQTRERSAADGLTISFDEGDAEQLPYADGSFGAIVSMFGAMFAPRPELVASELARVLAPGGLLAMANWIPPASPGRCSESAAVTFRLRRGLRRPCSGARRKLYAGGSLPTSRR